MGLVRGVARTAAIAGTATAVSNRVSRRQGNRWAAKEQQQYAAPPPQQQYSAPPQQYSAPPQQYSAPPQQYAQPAPVYAPPAAPAAAPTDRITALKDLAELKAAGILTDGEFEVEKAKILAS